MRDTKVQWHPGFVAAINLELTKNRDDLIFEKEYNLNTKPLEIDLLVIKKNSNISIENEIGKIFRGHNILEYKSPEDHLNIDVFFKVGAYASLYKSYGKTVDSIKEEDITVSLVRESKPLGLFRYFEEHGYNVSSPYNGIYYINSKVLFPTQIIVTGEIDRETHIWLRALSEKLEKQDIKELLEQIRCLTRKQDREFADSVLEVSMASNEYVVEKLMGDDSMSEALLEIVKPIIEPLIIKRENERLQQGMQQGIEQGMQQGIEQGIEQGMQQGIQQGIQKSVNILRSFGINDIEIKKAIKEQYELTEEELSKYI